MTTAPSQKPGSKMDPEPGSKMDPEPGLKMDPERGSQMGGERGSQMGPEQLATACGYEVRNTRALLGGCINENVLIETAAGPVVFRRYPPTRRRRQVEFEMSVLRHLRGVGCPVPVPLAAPRFLGVSQKRPQKGTQKGAVDPAIQTDGGRLFVFLSWCAGAPLELQTRPRAADLKEADAPLGPPIIAAGLPKIGAGLPKIGGADFGDELGPLCQMLRKVRAALGAMPPPFTPVPETKVMYRSVTALAEFLERTGHPQRAAQVTRSLKELEEAESQLALPASVIHADLQPKNLLVTADGAYSLVDFDDAHVGARLLDWVLPALTFSLAFSPGDDAPSENAPGDDAPSENAPEASTLSVRGAPSDGAADGLQVDEARYKWMLAALTEGVATAEEVQALSWARRLLLLKLAAAEVGRADSTLLGGYLALLQQDEGARAVP